MLSKSVVIGSNYATIRFVGFLVEYPLFGSSCWIYGSCHLAVVCLYLAYLVVTVSRIHGCLKTLVPSYTNSILYIRDFRIGYKKGYFRYHQMKHWLTMMV